MLRNVIQICGSLLHSMLIQPRKDCSNFEVGRLPTQLLLTTSKTKQLRIAYLAMRLDEGVPFAYELHLLVTRQTHGMEIGQAVAALDLLYQITDENFNSRGSYQPSVSIFYIRSALAMGHVFSCSAVSICNLCALLHCSKPKLIAPLQ